MAADTLGFTTYPPAYLSPQASGNNLLIGANFASAASGFDDRTAILSVTNLYIYISFNTLYIHTYACNSLIYAPLFEKRKESHYLMS